MVEKNISSIGQVFTPDYIADFMVKNALNFIPNKELKVLEPSVGEGVFLKYLIQYNIMDITAYEIDIKLGNKLSREYPKVRFKFENFLSADTSEKYDLIIGNPPYLGQNYNAAIFQDYVKIYPICAKYFVGNMDLFYFFIHQAIIKLKPCGILSFITTNYWITKSRKTGIKYLKPHIVEDCYLLQYIDLSSIKVFKEALGQHNCIFVLQKKSRDERNNFIDKNIDIVQIRAPINDISNEQIFLNISKDQPSPFISRYQSAITNKELTSNSNWFLKYPIEVKELVDKIENYCSFGGQVSYLQDLFDIRNGLILIRDDIFILQEGVNLRIMNNDIFIKVGGKFSKLNDSEKTRLKKIYKSKAIIPYSYDKQDYSGFLIYFDKETFNQDKYPNIIAYLDQYKEDLEEILINAKENPNDIYFSRRGSFITQYNLEGKRKLINLEPLYDNSPKIFFSYISKSNIFGYTEDAYYATSDTYFLWPKKGKKDIDYLFLLAYLNSKLVNFLFKAKNIKIKRSKTKLEDQLPIPNMKLFQSESKLKIIDLIRNLTLILIGNQKKIELPKFESIKKSSPNMYSQIKIVNDPHRLIDILILNLFNINEKNVHVLIEKYY